MKELESSSANPGASSILFITSVLRDLRRTLEEVTGGIDGIEAVSIVEEECPVQKLAEDSDLMKYLDCHFFQSWRLTSSRKSCGSCVNYESYMKFPWSIWTRLHWKSSGYDRIHLSEHNCTSKNSRGWASWLQKTRAVRLQSRLHWKVSRSCSVDAWLVSDELLSKRKFWYSGTTAERIFIVLRVVRSSSRCQESSGSRNARNEGRCTVPRFYEWECHDRMGYNTSKFSFYLFHLDVDAMSLCRHEDDWCRTRVHIKKEFEE